MDRSELHRVNLVLDGQHHVFDLTAWTRSGRPADFRAWLRRPVVELFAPGDRELVSASLRDVTDGKHVEIIAGLPVGEEVVPHTVAMSAGERFVHMRLEPVDNDEEPAPLSLRQERESNRLEYLGMVASRVSHDFKNLLAAILVNAEFLRQDEVDTESMHEVADEIMLATERAKELIEQILGYAGANPDPKAVIDINELMREMGRLLDVSTPPTVVMRYDLARDLPPVQGQASRFRQLMMNFIVNAAEAIGDDVGAIMITTQLIYAGAELLGKTRTKVAPYPGQFVCVEIEDTGPGLDAQTARQIFEPFFTTKKDGHGLGLSASLSIVEDHGGALLLDSTPGQGTVFRVLLPPSHDDASEGRSADPRRFVQDFSGHTVLLVDDEDLLRSVTRRSLRSRGFEVLTARDGLEGIEVFSAHHARLSCVLLDMGMPYIKGSDVFEEIRRINPSVPIVFVSGHSEEELYAHEAVRSAEGVLLKPFRDADLFEMLTGVLGVGNFSPY